MEDVAQWARTLEALSWEIDRGVFERRLRSSSLVAAREEGGRLHWAVEVPSAGALAWIEGQLKWRVLRTASRVTGRPVDITFRVARARTRAEEEAARAAADWEMGRAAAQIGDDDDDGPPGGRPAGGKGNGRAAPARPAGSRGPGQARHADGEAHGEARLHYERAHPMADAIHALPRAGLRPELRHELPFSRYGVLPWVEGRDDGLYRPRPDLPALPLLFSISAVKD